MSLKGKMDINGEILNKNDSLSMNGNSNILNGTLDFNLKNEKLNANLKNIDVQELSTMLDYSKFFDAKADFRLDYDFLLKKGDLNGKLLTGHFIENNFTQLLNQLAKDDLSKEIFETFDINSKIDNRILTSNLIMKSQNSEINIQDSILDLEKDLIDTKINSKIKDKTFTIGLNGNATNPKISIDVKDLLKDKIDKQIEKKKNKLKEKRNKVVG